MKTDSVTAEIAALKQQLSEQNALIEQLREQIILLTQKLYGPSSEKRKDDEPSPQLPLFDEAEVFADASVEAIVEETSEEAAPAATPLPRKKKRISLPESLPRRDVIYDLPVAAKVCPHDGSALKLIGEEISEQLHYIPATLEVMRHRRLKYACPCCDQHIVCANKPAQPIPKSFASPSLLAHIIVSKYADALPLYRQATMFQRLGVELDVTTLANWMIRCSELIVPLINLLHEKAQAQPVVHLDETVLQVLRESGRSAEQQSRMWVMVAPTVSSGRIVLFRYSETRSAEEAAELFGDSQAALMSDGYGGYDCLVKTSKSIPHLACWAHARRYFIDAQKAQPKGKQGKADHVVSQIRKLYRIEAETEPGSHQRFWRRSRESRPILDELRQWLDKCLENPIKQNALGKALTYLHNQWSKLVRYIENANWPIDNNAAENAIRPFVVGRKNWLFATSPKGAHASARLYSLIETAKAHGLEPERYLETVLTRLPQAQTLEDIEALLPWVIGAEKELQEREE